jgi:hypothetical protein
VNCPQDPRHFWFIRFLANHQIQDSRRSPRESPDWTVPISCARISSYVIYEFIGRAKTSLFYEWFDCEREVTSPFLANPTKGLFDLGLEAINAVFASVRSDILIASRLLVVAR